MGNGARSGQGSTSGQTSDTSQGSSSSGSSTERSQEVSEAHSKGVKKAVGASALGVGSALTAAASGGSIVAAAETLMPVATLLAQAAGMELPAAIMVAFLYQQSTGKPSKLEICARDWDEAAKELNQAAQHIRKLVQAIPGEAWTMDDRPLYESKIENFAQQLDALATYCSAIQVSLMVVAWALFIYAIFAMGMAVYLDALACAALFPPATAECMALAVTGLTVTKVATGILASAGVLVAAVMGGGSLVTAANQEDNGAENAFDAFKKAVATGSAGAAANIVQGGVNSGLNFFNRKGENMFPLAEVDLDADRSIDKTWNVGGGAKLTTPGGLAEGEAGYHAKIRDGHAQGQEAELKGKGNVPGDFFSFSGGGKLEWNEHESLANESFNVAAESGWLASKAEYEGSLNGNNPYSDKYSFNTPMLNRTDGSFQKKPDDEAPPWDKNL